ncbi:hypothetical protein GCM10010305_29150 [Streptomyces termitum]|uniref:Uncharacterized protein n=1 Tax=Streptomyces termitum TaxID=67368 RepID=A0A918WAF9_9ACTN|nr:hypothetical protein GCM10010305_29150 [Streptomyces termitum]
MVGVVEEEDEVAQAYEGVGAVPRPGEGLRVAVHVADHMDSHGPTLGGAVPVGPAITWESGKPWITVPRGPSRWCDARNIWPGPPIGNRVLVGNVRAVHSRAHPHRAPAR